ncbi:MULTISPECIES: DNA phosphorothioation-dependent restriction protein DptF [unclassified Endozoicomonas]|uniref:DNA phosphorothioation-dependent restriction protein DptF n=1 Tax=unclassified Endozoicomonas TaxID=2644528 RepID=UPI003BB6C51C
MKLRKLLAPLSRSSAEAVRTLGNSKGNPLKDYLYIKTPIETDFQRYVEDSNSPETIIFLCGSSGDGKSEILTKFYDRYEHQFRFHLDATHSFQPDMSAIQTLDNQFSLHKLEGKPIIVGINIGMLGNYAEEGSREHLDIIQSIKAFLNDDKEGLSPHHIFLNFEDYSKFKPEGVSVSADFIEKLLVKLTQPTDENAFYQAWFKEKDHYPEILHANYEMLQMPEVQKVIVQTLLKVRLKYDQFLTARTLLDFIYSALTGPGYLFDNIFTNTATELTRALMHFDPCTIRSKDIDIFLIQSSMKVKDDKFNRFKDGIRHLINEDYMEVGSWIRCFYLLQDKSLENNYHHQFRSSFNQELYQKYINIWRLHDQFDSKDKSHRDILRDFYQNDLLEAIFRFANRLAPELGQKQWYLADYNSYCLSTRAVIKDNLKVLPNNRSKRLGYFNAMLMLNGKPLEQPLQISANFLELIMKINSGYRPNKHDKNNIVILEEFIDQVTAQLRDSNQLKIHTTEGQWVLTNDEDYDEITVEEDY